jgi:hypothetical protein
LPIKRLLIPFEGFEELVKLFRSSLDIDYESQKNSPNIIFIDCCESPFNGGHNKLG